jgi:large subunit ribosomal protein L3
MTNGLLGKKLGMTQIFDETRFTPVTVIEAGPCRVVTIKTKERDGYESVQLSFGEVKERKLSKAELGHLKKTEAPATRVLREFKKTGEVTVGQSVKVDIFKKGDWVDVTGISKGKGFQGVVKRHHYAGGPESHGSMFSSSSRFDGSQFLSFSRLEREDIAWAYGGETNYGPAIESD